MALVGMVLFYGLERLAKGTRAPRAQDGVEDTAGAGVFWIHVGSFAVYNALIGYLLLHRERPGLTALLLFSVAMATHFVVNDFGLSQDHRRRYDRYGRWLLAAAVVAALGDRRCRARASGGRCAAVRVSRRGRRPERAEGGAAGGAKEQLLGVHRGRRRLQLDPVDDLTGGDVRVRGAGREDAESR
jgi:hypothetical protein